MHVSARSRRGDGIVFLHEIEAGPASRSYGVQVARLAGMPPALLRQARATLEALEAQRAAAQPQIDLFAAPRADAGRRAETESPLDEALARARPRYALARTRRSRRSTA